MTVIWGDPGATNGFVVNASTASDFTGTLFSSSTTNVSATTLQVPGLSPNTTYFVQAGAIYGGTTNFANTGPAGASTLAGALSNVLVYQVNFASITMNWTPFAPGFGVNTCEGYVLQASTSSNYSGVIRTSSTTATSVSTLTVTGLFSATNYYLRVGAMNWAGKPNFIPFGLVMTSATGISGNGVGGGGSASVAPATVAEGAPIQVSTITFVVPIGGFAGGGGVKVQLPFGWGPFLQTSVPSSSGYVSALTNPSTGLDIVPSTGVASVDVTLSPGQTLAAGSTIQVFVYSLWGYCPPPNQSTAFWGLLSRSASGAGYAPVINQPFQTLTAGAARSINFNPAGPLSVLSGQTAAIDLVGLNACGHPAAAGQSIIANLSGIRSDTPATDPLAEFALDSGFSTRTTTTTLLNGTTQATFYYRTATTGNNLMVKVSYTDPVASSATYITRPVNVLNLPVNFVGLALDNGTAAGGGTSFTLTPDNDGVNDIVFIRFAPSDPNTSWRVCISSDGFNSCIYERSGTGNPNGSLQWDARLNNNGTANNNFVPNGVYPVRVEVPGLSPNDSLTITVQAASISGHVLLGGAGFPNAWVNANANSGYGSGGAMTDANGAYVINGLRAGQGYNLFTNFYDTTTLVQMNASLSNITAPAAAADLSIIRPAILRVAASLNPTPSAALFGQAFARTSDYSKNYYGSIRVQAGQTVSDNGDSFNPSTWTVLVVQPGTYSVQLSLPGFSPLSRDVTVLPGQTLDVPVFSFTRQANVYGLISLPAAVDNSAWISVEGVKSGNTTPTIWGGANFNVGDSTGVYQVYNVSPGDYTFRIRVPGYVPATVVSTVGTADIGDSMNGGLDFPVGSFTTGGIITGTITVQGKTSDLGSSLSLWINAYSPARGSGESAQVTLSTDATHSSTTYKIGGLTNGTYQVFPPYLSGFDVTPPGPRTVVVSGGMGRLDLTLIKNTGGITGNIVLPVGKTDYGQVTISIQGPMITTTTVATAQLYTIPALAGGYYTVTASYATTGAQVRWSVAVVNDHTSTQDLDLSAPTYPVAGTVAIERAFMLSRSSGAPVPISTIADMVSNGTTQYFSIDGAQVPVPTARVEAFLKRFDSYGNANRTGFGNNFSGADYKFGAIQADGHYSIPGLSPGVWELSVYPFLDGGQTPSLAAAKQTLTIAGASPPEINFSVSAGYSVGGTISLAGGATDSQTFNVTIQTDRGDYVQSSQIPIGSAGNPAASTTYLFKNLAPGRYVLVVQDPGTLDPDLDQLVRKYVAKPAAFEIAAANVANLNLTLGRSSRIVGKLSIRVKDANGTVSSTLITTNNSTLLPNNLRIAAVSDPWVEGGYQQATIGNGGVAGASNGRLEIDANNQFQIEGLVAGTYDVQFQQDSYGSASAAQGSVNLAAYTQGQVTVTEGQAVDIGTIELKPGLSLYGTVVDTAGNALPNIRVRTQSSGKHEGGNSSNETFTDAAGQFTLAGLSPDLKTYDVIVAPRPGGGDLTPPSPYGQIIKKAIDVTQNPPVLAFILTAANASLSGQILTVDLGPLGYPDGDKQQGYPAAAIYLQARGVPSSGDNPLGDIQEASALDGSFSITSLIPGVYDGQVVSLNYKPSRFSVTIAPGSNSAGTITLQKGAGLTATLARPDGSGVTTTDVDFAVAVTADLGSIIFGQISSDDNTKTIRSIRFSGFDSTKRYSVLLFDKRDNIVTPPEGRTMSFATDTEEKTLALTFQPSAPTAFVQVRKVISAVEMTFYFSRSLRNTLPSDNVPIGLMTVESGHGVLSSGQISGDRQSMTLLYTPPADEQTATVRFNGFAADVDPATGSEFPMVKRVILRFGQKASAEKNISPVLGGEITLSETANDPSGVIVPANAFLDTSGSVADTSANYAISFTVSENASGPSSLGAMRARAGALGVQMARGRQAYVPEVYDAMTLASASASVDPFSAFYSVLLPTGLSHTLNQTATLTLQYDTLADPSLINIYFFNGANYMIEKANRTIDPVNHTITVGVSHFSTFVVLQNDVPVVITDGDSASAADVEVFNFPNPFDLQSKTKTLGHDSAGSGRMTTSGTIIRYTVPPAKAGAAHIDIYDVVGEKVRSIDLGTPAANTYHYVDWDGKNDSGRNVASGVYIGVLKVGADKKFWKMAVIK